MATIDHNTAALIVSSAVEFMANKAGMTAQEIVAAIDADRTGAAASYLRQLIAVGRAAALS